MSILSRLFSALDNYGDDTLKSIAKKAGGSLDDIAASKKLWNGIGESIDKGVTGSSIRDSMKSAALTALDAGDDKSAKVIMSNMPVVAHSSPHFDDLLSEKVGSYFQMTPANNIEPVGGLTNELKYTTIIDPESALKKGGDKYTKLISELDTGLGTGKGKTLEQWSDDLKKEIGGKLHNVEISDRKDLQDYVYRGQGKWFDNSGDDLTYQELAMPRQEARSNLQKEFKSYYPEDFSNTKIDLGNNIAEYAINKMKSSPNRSKEFDRIFLSVAPIVGGGSILGSLLSGANNKERSQNV